MILTFNFRILNFKTEGSAYLFKTVVAGVSNQTFTFGYMPYGRYVSVAMLEFLAGQYGSEPSAELIEAMTVAIREELRGEADCFLVLDFADRDLRPRPLHVAKQVSVSNRLSEQALSVLRSQDVALRVDSGVLYVESTNSKAVRNSEATTKVINEMAAGNRTISFNGAIVTPLLSSSRSFSWESTVAKNNSQADRVSQFDLSTVIGVQATRDTINHLLVQRGALQAIRSIQVNSLIPFAHIANSMDNALRVIRSEAHLGKEMQATRDTKKKMYLPADYTWANLSGSSRQYPTLLWHNLSSAMRDVTRSTAIYQDDTVATRIQSFAGILPNTLGSASRKVTRDTFVDKVWAAGARLSPFTLLIPSVKVEGFRKSPSGSLFIPVESIGGFRSFLKPAVVPNDVSEIWDRELPPGVEAKDPRASFLMDDHTEANNTDNRHGISLFDLLTGSTDGTKHGLPLFYLPVGSTDGTKHGAITDVWEGGVVQRVLLGQVNELEYGGTVLRKLNAFFMDTIYGQKGFESYVMDDVLVGIREILYNGEIDELISYAIKTANLEGFLTQEYMDGVRERIEGMVDYGFLVSSGSNRDGVITFDFTGEADTRPSILDNGLEASDDFHPADFSFVNPLGYTEPSPSWLGEGADAFKPIDRNALVDEGGAFGSEEAKPSVFNEANEFDRVLKDSELPNEMVGVREAKESLLNESSEGSNPPRPSIVPDSLLATPLHERISILTTEYIVADKPIDRIACLYDIYVLGVNGIRDGEVDSAEFNKFASLILDTAILEEGMFAIEPERASQLLEHLVGILDPRGSIIEEGYEMDKVLHMGNIVESFLGNRVKAQAIMGEYELAQRTLYEGYVDQMLLGKEQIKKAMLEYGSEAQGLIYDYTNDVLEDGMDVENWTGGFAVPEDYDHSDPYNQYFPWAKDMNAVQLDNDDWVRFGDGTWRRDKVRDEFIADTDVPLIGGYYRNVFKYTDYVFSVDFKVEDTGDDGVGIVFRYADSNNYHYLLCSGGDADGSLGISTPMQLFRVKSGVTTPVAPPMNSFPWAAGKWNTMEVKVEGNRTRLKVNGRLQYDYTE
jgi:hypothetical protein